MNNNIDLAFTLNEEDIEVSLTLTSPEKYEFEDSFELDLLIKNADEQDLLVGEFLAKEIIAELKKLNVHVSYEAECDIIDQTIVFADWSELDH